MGFGGAVWHSSVAPAGGNTLSRDELYAAALRAIDGVGNPLKQWEEWSGYAYHIRRRLSKTEQDAIGPVRDLRGTQEGIRIMQAWQAITPHHLHSIAFDEVAMS